MMDEVLELWVGGLIELAGLKWRLSAGRNWTPGEKLKLLVVAYNGARNTGEDVRVEEIVRQVRRVLGEKNLALTVPTIDFDLTRGYFGDAAQVKLPYIFPPFLSSEVPRHDGVIACLGPTFSATFASAVTTLMVGAMGIASVRNKLAVAYGVEAGRMDGILTAMCGRFCADSLAITRNENSRSILRELGVPTELGTDTAWTFEPHGPEYGNKALRDAGWDGKRPVIAVCPNNPFRWPVRASLAKGLARALTGAFRESHYRSIYFYNSGPKALANYQRYLNAFAKAVDALRQQHQVFPIMVAMERLDAGSCEDLSRLLGGTPVFTSAQYDMYQLVSILRSCQLMVSSRFHGIVTSMPGLVASAGVTMDERIRNLMHERGQAHLLLEANDPELEPKLTVVLETLFREREAVRDAIGRTVVKNLKAMARMGTYFEEHVQKRYPDFPIRSGLRSWEEYLPPLTPGLRSLLERYDS